MNTQEVFSALQYKLGALMPISIEDIEAVSSFAVLWNVYEAKFYNKKYNVDAMIDLVEDRKIDIIEKDVYINFFYNRYFEEDNGYAKFSDLKLSEKSGKSWINVNQMVERVLTNSNSSREEHKIKAILSIIYRLRNNLFHGEKSMSNIHEELKPIHVANKCLLNILQNCDFIY